MSQFDIDLEQGKKIEQKVEAFLNEKYPFILTENSSNKGLFPYWDISTTSTTNNKITKLEVKYLRNNSNNNVVIENGRIVDEAYLPTALGVSESDYYIMVFENDVNYYSIPTQKLKELCADDTQTNKWIMFDTNGYQLTIFTKEFLLQFAKIL